MNRGLYRKLAFNNIKKNKNTFFPFALACIVMIAMFYMLGSIRVQVNENVFFGARTMRTILGFGSIVCGIFSFFVIFYTNRFLMKQRSKEFGLYSILGMEKKHIGKVVFWEIAIIGTGSIIIGLLSGMLFSKLMFMVLLKLLKLDTDFDFVISWNVAGVTFLLFAALFLLIMVVNFIRVFRLKPIELMSGSHAGEKEPKAKWVMAILGIICLGSGYYIAQTTGNPLQAIATFFVAVLLVIAGTYFLFMSGSIALLKLLKKNKNFYYQKNHFITVSGMMYRMKQNAAGLSNICILSTAVLVILSSTVSLYIGTDDILNSVYPREVEVFFYDESNSQEFRDGKWVDKKISRPVNFKEVEAVMRGIAGKYNVKIKNVMKYADISTAGLLEGDTFIVPQEEVEDFDSVKDEVIVLEAMTVEDYNGLMGTKYEAKEGEVYLYVSEGVSIKGETIRVFETEFPVYGYVKEIPKLDSYSEGFKKLWMIVPDRETLKTVSKSLQYDEYGHEIITYNYKFDLTGSDENKKRFAEHAMDDIYKTKLGENGCGFGNSYAYRDELFGVYSSLFFVGLFLGTMFLITTAMIIYYKQVSEGYDDRERFNIMQKVGMGEKEVKSVINSQIVMVFFLPIIVAIVHISFAFKLIKDLLYMFGLTNVSLYIRCTIGTVIVFFLVYGIVYKLTAKAYYRITQQ